MAWRKNYFLKKLYFTSSKSKCQSFSWSDGEDGSDWSEFCQALFQRFRKDLGFLDFFATPISNLRELVDNRIFAWVYFYLFLYAMGAFVILCWSSNLSSRENNKFHQSSGLPCERFRISALRPLAIQRATVPKTCLLGKIWHVQNFPLLC